MIKVSVILPVYGVAEYIEKCTRSLLAQTLQEMEFIFVDDHGPDNSIELAKQAIKGHTREKQFIFLKPEHNLGAGMARNFAIPYAKGEYIAFVDSDDWVEPDMFEQLYEAAKDADICYCQAFKDYTDGAKTEILTNPVVEDGIFDDKKRNYFLTHYVSLFWTFLYKRELVMERSIRFSEDRSADDTYFETCALLTAQTVARVDKPFYHYLIRPGSVCSTKDSVKYKKRLATFSRLMRYAKEQKVYGQFKDAIDYLYIKKGYLATLENYLINSLEPQSEIFRSIHESLLTEVPDYKQNIFLKSHFQIRVLVTLTHRCPRTAMRVLTWYAKKTNAVV
ncbi:MAG: glycosyltransferase [Paludibacteraceae bacterium]|nr:glycosyltransferase [Paludibacteraceae bacterium]